MDEIGSWSNPISLSTAYFLFVKVEMECGEKNNGKKVIRHRREPQGETLG